jgi:hypothetical protein
VGNPLVLIHYIIPEVYQPKKTVKSLLSLILYKMTPKMVASFISIYLTYVCGFQLEGTRRKKVLNMFLDPKWIYVEK